MLWRSLFNIVELFYCLLTPPTLSSHSHLSCRPNTGTGDSAQFALADRSTKKPSIGQQQKCLLKLWAFYTHFSRNIKSFFSSGLSCYLKINLIKGPNNSCRASLLFCLRIATAHCKCSGLLGSSSRRWRHNKNGKCVETTLTKICNQANSFAKLG